MPARQATTLAQRRKYFCSIIGDNGVFFIPIVIERFIVWILLLENCAFPTWRVAKHKSFQKKRLS